MHSDIGGGYPEAESGAAKIPLKWMVDGARQHGLVFREEMVRRLVEGQNPQNSTRHYTAPAANADLHDSMNNAWAILEWLPKSAKLKEWKDRRSRFGAYLPRSEPRLIPADADIDPSVYERTHHRAGKPHEPINLPPKRVQCIVRL